MDETNHAQTIAYEDVWLLGGVRTPFADFNGTLRDISALTLARELKRAKERYGIATACAGGGQGVAILIENPDAGS